MSANFGMLYIPNISPPNSYPMGYTDLESQIDTVSKVNEISKFLNETLDGTITEKIADKINTTFINGMYNENTETLILTITFPA